MMKLCKRCGDEKPLSEFNRNRTAHDGLQSDCKSCRTERNREYREEHPEIDRAQKRRANRQHPDRRAKARRKQLDEKREQTLAHRAVERAVKRGDLQRPSHCESCGCDRRLVAHHEDYTKQLDVAWLCDRCHQRRHQRESEQAA